MIGFLTILSYALYDTTVVFDKIRETTSEDGEISGRTFGESVNLAVNQTLIRSINTTVVAILPRPERRSCSLRTVLLGAGTLTDISLALFVGTIVGDVLVELFVATPSSVALRDTGGRSRSTPARC